MPNIKDLQEKELKKLKGERMDILLQIVNRDIAPDFYNVLKEAIECFSVHEKAHNSYEDILGDLWKLQQYFYLQTLIGKR